MAKKKPPRPEQLTAEKKAKAADYRHDPAYAYTPGNGGYKNGKYYGAETFPGLGDGVAEEGATHQTDNRLCSECGMQRTFQWERGRWIDPATGDDIEDQDRGPELSQQGKARWYGFGSMRDDAEKIKCNACSGRLGHGRDAMS